MSVQDLPRPLAAQLGAVPRDGVLAHEDLVLRWSPLELTVERNGHSAEVSADNAATLEVARSVSPRRLLGIFPYGEVHWLHVELRTSRDVLVSLCTPVEAQTVTGLPWSQAGRSNQTNPHAVMTVLAAARRAGARVASWSQEDERHPSERPTPTLTAEDKDSTDEASQSDSQDKGETSQHSPHQGGRLKSLWQNDKPQVLRHLLATICASCGWIVWFNHDEMSVAFIPALAMVVLSAITLGGPKSRILVVVYGGVAVVGWPFAGIPLGILEPDSPYPQVSANFYDWELDSEITFKEQVQYRPELAGAASGAVQKCHVAPLVAGNWSKSYNPTAFLVCCAPVEDNCSLPDSLGQHVFSPVPESPVMRSAADHAARLHEFRPIGTQRVVYFTSVPGKEIPGQSLLMMLVVGTILWLLGVVIANGVVVAMRPEQSSPNRKESGSSWSS